MIPLLDRLRQELPGDWQPVTDQPAAVWRGDPRTVSLQIGGRRLYVNLWPEPYGGIVGSEHSVPETCLSWDTLCRTARRHAAKIVIDEIRQENPAPDAPEWARIDLCRLASERCDSINSYEQTLRRELARLTAEREALSALLSTITLGA